MRGFAIGDFYQGFGFRVAVSGCAFRPGRSTAAMLPQPRDTGNGDNVSDNPTTILPTWPCRLVCRFAAYRHRLLWAFRRSRGRHAQSTVTGFSRLPIGIVNGGQGYPKVHRISHTDHKQ
jgi:hypothetical protein